MKKTLSLLIILLVIFTSCSSFDSLRQPSHDKQLDIINRESEVKKFLDVIKERRIGIRGWYIHSCVDNELIVLDNGLTFLILSKTDSGYVISNAIDLSDFNFNLMLEGPGYFLRISPNGNAAVIIDKDAVYYLNLLNGEFKELSKGIFNNLIYNWSNSSNYLIIYTFDNAKVNSKIIIYDVKSDEIEEIIYDKEEINRMFISDDGDIVIDASDKYLHKNKSLNRIDVNGDIIGIKNDIIYSYSKNTLYKMVNGNKKIIKELDNKNELIEIEQERIMFANSSTITIFNTVNEEIYTYENDINNRVRVNLYQFSSNSNKYIHYDYYKEIIEIVYSNGERKVITDNFSSNFSTLYVWMDENNLIKLVQKDNSMQLGDFMIIRKDINADKDYILFDLEEQE